MTQIETVQFSCPSCGKRLLARAQQGGRIYACPGCGGPVPVPQIGNAPPSPPAEPEAEAPEAGIFSRMPASIGELAIVLFVLWSIVAFVSLLVTFIGGIAFYVGLIMFLLASLVAAQQAWQLLRAPQKVLTVKEVPLFWGTVRLIAWEPVEGILILRNKAITFKDDDLHDGKGGVRFIYPFLGEEVALRVPLETQTLTFADDHVLTREYLHLGIRGTMKWRIDNIENFYLRVSRELRETSDAKSPDKSPFDKPRADGTTASSRKLVDAAVAWLRSIAQEQTRSVVSRVRSGLLIADKVAADLPEVRQNDSAELGGAADGLASAIHEAVAERLAGYGIAVTEVSLVEIRMPQAIVEQCVEAAKTAYLPLMAKNQASKRQADLTAEANVLGREAVAAREVIAAAPAYALRDFLTDVVAKNTSVTGVTTPTVPVATIDVAKLAAIEHTAQPNVPAAPADDR